MAGSEVNVEPRDQSMDKVIPADAHDKGMLKVRSSALQLYRSRVNTLAGSVTTAFISTVSTRGSDRAVYFRGV